MILVLLPLIHNEKTSTQQLEVNMVSTQLGPIYVRFLYFRTSLYWVCNLMTQCKKIFVNQYMCVCYFFIFFLAFDFCRLCVVIRLFHPATTVNDLRLRRIFYPRFYPLHLFSYLNSWERASIFPFECSVLTKGTTGTIFITSLVWRGPWLGIEPGTSRTRIYQFVQKRTFHIVGTSSS